MKFTASSVLVLVCLFFSVSLSSHTFKGKKPTKKTKKYRTYKLNSSVKDFKLKNAVDGNMVSLSDYQDAKGFILVFISNSCPTTQLYEERIIKLQEKYAHKGYQVVAVNPYNPTYHPQEGFENSNKMATRKQYNFPYLVNGYEVAQRFGAVKTPQVYVLQKKGKRLKIKYIGAIDNKPRLPKYHNTKYTEKAVKSLLAGSKRYTKVTRPLGTTIDHYVPTKADELVSRK
ncbi:redoxin domain-containing protein [uncultured Microscilla sp.]|uniref:redoxin domain-containing protein n=1 Tax=uncultured Microscilla sp. TaxID=432653 RepID=UPI002632837D|nr:redoxin domain-containing protein [uncultured Microscilla sp.]